MNAAFIKSFLEQILLGLGGKGELLRWRQCGPCLRAQTQWGTQNTSICSATWYQVRQLMWSPPRKTKKGNGKEGFLEEVTSEPRLEGRSRGRWWGWSMGQGGLGSRDQEEGESGRGRIPVRGGWETWLGCKWTSGDTNAFGLPLQPGEFHNQIRSLGRPKHWGEGFGTENIWRPGKQPGDRYNRPGGRWWGPLPRRNGFGRHSRRNPLSP